MVAALGGRVRQGKAMQGKQKKGQARYDGDHTSRMLCAIFGGARICHGWNERAGLLSNLLLPT